MQQFSPAGYTARTGDGNRATTRISMGALRAAAAVTPLVAFTTNRLLTGLPAATISRLRPHLKEVTLIKEEYLFQQDESVESVFFPETAVISEYQILEDGRTIEVTTTGRDSAVGIPSAFGSRRAINCSQVCIGGKALRLRAEVLERELSICEEVHRPLQDSIIRQMKHLSQKVICNTFHSVEQRFCTWLLTLQNRSNRERFRLTHEHVARVLGVHRPSVTCIAQTLRDKKLIDYGRARLIISDAGGLRKLACRCSADLHLSEAIH